MATLKQPKKKKYPKKPKANASSDSMTRWLEKVKAIDKEFESATSDFKKEKKKREDLKKKVSDHKR